LHSISASALFFLQLAVIIGTCRCFGWLAKRVGQPHVMGEMLAGIFLGPSILGLLAPTLQQAIFPSNSVGVLYVVAQAGVALYMFLVGLEFRSDEFKLNAGSAFTVSVSGTIAPFAIAAVLTPWLFHQGLFGRQVVLSGASLFTGVAIGITAFPMLARIIHECRLDGTPIGTIALSAGAMGDAAAWVLLALLLATFDSSLVGAILPIAGGATFATMMLFLAPKLLAPLGRIAEREARVSPALLGIVLTIFAVCAFAMDWIGLHAVLGAFLLGVACPRGVFSTDLKRQMEPLVLTFLTPLFFSYSGLNTKLTVLANGPLALVAVVVILCAFIGKAGACWAAARITGQSRQDSLAIGALMNSHGMMELIVINIGLQRGIIGTPLFSILALMAVVTTWLATPIVKHVIERRIPQGSPVTTGS
jgi:Kef-type K+ transport system membrane component KefB